MVGHALFFRDVGRVDLLGVDKAEQMARNLCDSIFEKILPLGDEGIVCPAHGAGSVCGSSIAERTWTTVGIERKQNPKLQYEEKSDFVENIVEKLERPPYFRKMEELNLRGPPLLHNPPVPEPLSPDDFYSRAEDALVLDFRSELGFTNSHVPDSISIWLDGIPNFAGWFLSYEKPFLLVGEESDIESAARDLIRIGYDNIAGYLAGGMLSWYKAGKEPGSIKTKTVQELCGLLDEGESPWILDVRSEEEVEKQEIPDANHIHLTQLLDNTDEIPEDRKIYIFCGSGLRSTVAASLLKLEGFEDLVVVKGGFSGWNSVTCL